MNKTKSSRIARLLPGGVPRYVRRYDNGGETYDRYTAVFSKHKSTSESNGCRTALAMSASPFHPQGFGQHTCAMDTNKHGFAPAIGRKNHLGKRIPFAELPEDCRKLVLQDYREIWNLN